jgi:hypothetical protein
VGGVQVVVEDPADRGGALTLVITDAGLFSGARAQQVVEGVSPRNVFGDQMVAGELAQEAAGRRLIGGGQAGGRRRGDIGSWVQAKQPEHSR